ncbi:hypothetical protein J1N35_005752 [Gossypium stocksii]|uniref:Uncharacterized protein n=1 Tax=Gossypium stocksii TaxID=47602 RepID=A0A9D3WEH3_9ROSI|nr:hypothetical protein J1N35_005752 [Gossypium stocksii]
MSNRVRTITSGTYPGEVRSGVDTVVDTRGLSGREQFLQCYKGNAPFEATTDVVIKQLINNYNRYCADSSLTSTLLEHPLST